MRRAAAKAGDAGMIENGEFTFRRDPYDENAGRRIFAPWHGGIRRACLPGQRDGTRGRKHPSRHDAQPYGSPSFAGGSAQTLGNHVEQAGSMVNSKEVRFDFSHFEAMTPQEIRQVEELVNQTILAALPVTTREMPLEEAKQQGAMALFGEKYGATVRVVQAGDFSTELCGGTHVENTAQLGLFKIVAESSVAAGVRRIQGVTGAGVLECLYRDEALLHSAAQAMKANNVSQVAERAQQLSAELKEAQREVARLNDTIAARRAKELFAHGPTGWRAPAGNSTV